VQQGLWCRRWCSDTEHHIVYRLTLVVSCEMSFGGSCFTARRGPGRLDGFNGEACWCHGRDNLTSGPGLPPGAVDGAVYASKRTGS